MLKNIQPAVLRTRTAKNYYNRIASYNSTDGTAHIKNIFATEASQLLCEEKLWHSTRSASPTEKLVLAR